MVAGHFSRRRCDAASCVPSAESALRRAASRIIRTAVEEIEKLAAERRNLRESSKLMKRQYLAYLEPGDAE